ncbi:MAG: hypothetical protein V5789_08990 [Colwellia sp.]
MLLSHGEIEISRIDNVITSVFIGAFNVESLRDYTKKIKSIVTALNDKPFAMIIDDTKLEGGTPEAFEELESLNAWISNTQLKAKAFVINSELNKEIILARTPSLSLQNAKFFLNHQEANAWLETFFE